MIVTFDKYLAPELGPDPLERLGNVLLYPIIRGFGSLVSVKTLGEKRFLCFSDKVVSLCVNAFFVWYAIFSQHLLRVCSLCEG
ncbi:hypothetical protein FTN76_02335 [Chlamydia trachomatis]|nr:hypothetical protein CTL2C_728 [Chlamydia trachomatis L2c]AGR94502.1 hypothetical protein CTRC46_00860 [Chlamydia trachomatis RC-L2(s)/46]AGR96380.1 hypothetical protein CTRC943_00845 [Chlamydia trachomatis RC-J/943]AGR97307.1 hypothetical protein CTRC953_00850 [Chlamydia trachomatis RC-J/953]AGS01035.1 hypothetical protein CTRC966_00860 [Chlamydia trachomatis RC-J/966]AGS02916.1 hypothetical protein CTRC971_00855 [Chlamydia trachomatis RC-J/971]AGS03841.1 hypothetical protein CTRC55_00855